jgi:hypothetical protein
MTPSRARSLVGLLALATLAAAWPRAAWALCPNCLGQQSALTPTLKLVGLFLLVPFAVATVVYRVVRRTQRPRAPDRARETHPAVSPAHDPSGTTTLAKIV